MNKAILLSGGVGTRLSSDIPKQNIKVEDRMNMNWKNWNNYTTANFLNF